MAKPISNSERLKLATNDLQLSLVCIGELAKQKKVGSEVWKAASDWQAAALKRWRGELSEMGCVSSVSRNVVAPVELVSEQKVAAPPSGNPPEPTDK